MKTMSSARAIRKVDAVPVDAIEDHVHEDLERR